MDVKVAAINQVFLNNRVLKIPFFQRGYVWVEKNWEQFFNDIASIASIDDEDEREKYFLGSIIVKECGSRKLDVIDGQQRLTTIVMFMKALYLCMNRNDLFRTEFMQKSLSNEVKPILVTNYNDQDMYNQIINLELPKRDPIRKDNRLAECHAYFVRRILEAQHPTDGSTPLDPVNLLYAVTDNVRLVVIEVQQGENAQKIFETINCSGIKLTTGEMLKNYLFDESKVAEYERTWKQVFESVNRQYWEGEMVNGRIADSHIENFFYRYMLIKAQAPGIKENLSVAEAKAFRQKEGLFEKYRKLMQKFNIQKDEAIEEFVEYAKLYMETFKKDTLAEAAVQYPGIERLTYLMYAQDAWTMTPYILFVMKNVTDRNERTRIFSYMENYLMRRMICKSKNNNYSDMFSENLIGQRVLTYSDFRAYVNDEKSRGALLMPTNEEVVVALKTKDLKLSAQTILYMLESKINPELVSSNCANSIQSFTYESIMTEKATANWPLTPGMTDDERKSVSRTLGNYVLLRTKLKTKAKAAAWKDKCVAMKPEVIGLETSVVVTRGLANWDADTIAKRNSWLADKVLEAWPM